MNATNVVVVKPDAIHSWCFCFCKKKQSKEKVIHKMIIYINIER